MLPALSGIMFLDDVDLRERPFHTGILYLFDDTDKVAADDTAYTLLVQYLGTNQDLALLISGGQVFK